MGETDVTRKHCKGPLERLKHYICAWPWGRGKKDAKENILLS